MKIGAYKILGLLILLVTSSSSAMDMFAGFLQGIGRANMPERDRQELEAEDEKRLAAARRASLQNAPTQPWVWPLWQAEAISGVSSEDGSSSLWVQIQGTTARTENGFGSTFAAYKKACEGSEARWAQEVLAELTLTFQDEPMRRVYRAPLPQADHLLLAELRCGIFTELPPARTVRLSECCFLDEAEIVQLEAYLARSRCETLIFEKCQLRRMPALQGLAFVHAIEINEVDICFLAPPQGCGVAGLIAALCGAPALTQLVLGRINGSTKGETAAQFLLRAVSQRRSEEKAYQSLIKDLQKGEESQTVGSLELVCVEMGLLTRDFLRTLCEALKQVEVSYDEDHIVEDREDFGGGIGSGVGSSRPRVVSSTTRTSR